MKLFSLLFSCMITVAMYTSDDQHHSNTIVSTHPEKEFFLTALVDLCSGKNDGIIVSSANLNNKSVYLKVLREKDTYFERTYTFSRTQELANTTYALSSVFNVKYNQEIRDMFGADFAVGSIFESINQEFAKRNNDSHFLDMLIEGNLPKLIGAIHATRPGKIIFEKGKISVFANDEAKQDCCC